MKYLTIVALLLASTSAIRLHLHEKPVTAPAAAKTEQAKAEAPTAKADAASATEKTKAEAPVAKAETTAAPAKKEQKAEAPAAKEEKKAEAPAAAKETKKADPTKEDKGADHIDNVGLEAGQARSESHPDMGSAVIP